jgi:putative transposase
MSQTRLLVHALWATRDHARAFTPYTRRALFSEIRRHALAHHIELFAVGGTDNPIHLLLGQHPAQSVDTLVRMIQDGSACWINAQHLVRGSFRWQQEYAAFSVSPEQIFRVRSHILHQEEYHRRRRFADEWEMLQGIASSEDAPARPRRRMA